jgi:hypothetical protein
MRDGEAAPSDSKERSDGLQMKDVRGGAVARVETSCEGKR